jgi:hypothetical protein
MAMISVKVRPASLSQSGRPVVDTSGLQAER